MASSPLPSGRFTSKRTRSTSRAFIFPIPWVRVRAWSASSPRLSTIRVRVRTTPSSSSMISIFAFEKSMVPEIFYWVSFNLTENELKISL